MNTDFFESLCSTYQLTGSHGQKRYLHDWHLAMHQSTDFLSWLPDCQNLLKQQHQCEVCSYHIMSLIIMYPGVIHQKKYVVVTCISLGLTEIFLCRFHFSHLSNISEIIKFIWIMFILFSVLSCHVVSVLVLNLKYMRSVPIINYTTNTWTERMHFLSDPWSTKALNWALT